jgi:ParB/RepB/Spo0J family partition protein
MTLVRPGAVENIEVARIDVAEHRERDADLSPRAIAELAASIGQQGLLQPIGVRPSEVAGEVRYQLVWGSRRLEAYRCNPDALGEARPAQVLDGSLSDEDARLLEVVENALRQELTADERAAHTLLVAARVREIDAASRSRHFADFPEPSRTQTPATSRAKTGRGHKGAIQKVAESLDVSHRAVRHRAQKVAEAIGEPISVEADPPDELARKAAKAKSAVSNPRRRFAAPPRAKPKAPAAPDLVDQLVAWSVAWPDSVVEAYAASMPPERRKQLKHHLGDILRKLEALRGGRR